MKRFEWRWLVVSSLLVSAMAAHAETRPQYGGTLHVAMRAAPVSLDPADGASDSFGRRNLTMLLFESLVTLDDGGHVQPALAVSWQAAPGSRRSLQFILRRGVKFHDSTPLSAEIAAASLRTANPSWNVAADGESVVIERDGSGPESVAELALPRNAITKKNPDGLASGTGPFQITDWQPGKKLTVSANDGYWGGRPFLDGIEIELGRSYRDQMIALELGKANLVEVPAEQLHRVSVEGRRVASSAPVELLALVFSRDAASPEEKSLREALALSVERGSICSVLLQGAGQPAASILPNWMSGYSFVFSTEAGLPHARHEREQVPTIPTWTIGYDSNDGVARLLAERIALNAKDAGLSLQPTTATSSDLRLVRIGLASADPWIALTDVAARVGAPTWKSKGTSVEELYAAEQSLLATRRIIPLFHLPVSYAASTLKNWAMRPDGSWTLADAWLESGKP